MKAKVHFVQDEDSDLYKVVATLEDGRVVTIADGNSWRLDDIGIPCLLGLGPHLGEA